MAESRLFNNSTVALFQSDGEMFRSTLEEVLSMGLEDARSTRQRDASAAAYQLQQMRQAELETCCSDWWQARGLYHELRVKFRAVEDEELRLGTAQNDQTQCRVAAAVLGRQPPDSRLGSN